MTEWIAQGAALMGAVFMLLAAGGMFRMKNFYHRVHAPTKAATLGLFFLLAATAIEIRVTGATAKAFLAILFFAGTAPAGAHMLARAAYRKGVAAAPETGKDEYAAINQPSASPARGVPAKSVPAGEPNE